MAYLNSEQDNRPRLDRHPRIELTRAPTPLQHLPHLSARLGVQLAVKRDDLTDLALGGDKPRKLEYELAGPVRDGVDWLVGCGSAQSNFARLLTAAARHLGLGCSLVLARGEHPEDQGNLLVVRLMGGDVHLVDTDDIWDLDAQCLALCDELRLRGHRPHYVPVSGTTPVSCLGYVRAGFELATQLDEDRLDPAALYIPFGTGGIAAGLAVGLHAAGKDVPLIGCSVNRPADACARQFADLVAKVQAILGLPPSPLEAEVRDDQLGAGYGKVTDSCLAAIHDFAETEGLLLDPVYSGKVGATLLADCRSGRWPADAQIVMLHSGGVPAIFAYSDDVLRLPAERR
jgi:1-aminocyclopropane-1-carboxylate deaminase/D-cysteine desulfhydrase-like pyridoxal-dependent ACC family enzyme